jgi:hypothetical protein
LDFTFNKTSAYKFFSFKKLAQQKAAEKLANSKKPKVAEEVPKAVEKQT